MNITCKNTSNDRVYDPLYRSLSRAIREGEYSPGALIGTETDFASQAGISRPSVRKAVELLVRDGLVERRPGKGLYVRKAGKAVTAVQVILPDLGSRVWSEFAAGAQEVGRARGVQIQICDARGGFDRDLDFIERLPDSGVDAAIIWPPPLRRIVEVLAKLKMESFPFVLIDQSYAIDVPTFSTDHYAGGVAVGRELIRHGHKRIGFIGVEAISQAVQLRLQGLRDAMADSDFLLRPCWVQMHDLGESRNISQVIHQAARDLINLPDRPTAIFCASDGVAADCIVALKSFGLNLPYDISVAGFDDESYCPWLDPTLSTIRQPAQELGRLAIEAIVTRIHDPGVEVVSRVLPGVFISRNSIAPPPSESCV